MAGTVLVRKYAEKTQKNEKKMNRKSEVNYIRKIETEEVYERRDINEMQWNLLHCGASVASALPVIMAACCSHPPPRDA